ncbi:MAG: hypothetical protein LR011_00615, partial [Verrucomicrobia bacterium]|nr:hypothetical protein [Verrucomicrobiota bacterium]
MSGFRNLLIFLAIIPLAIVLGYQVASGTTMGYAAVAGCVLFVTIPFLLRFYEPLFVVSINSAFLFPFLPGQPQVKLLVSLFVIGLAIVDRTINKKNRFSMSRSLFFSLLFLALVILLTMVGREGIGGRALGGDLWGLSKYVEIFKGFAILLAFSVIRIPTEKAQLYTALFFLGAISHSISNLVYSLGSDFMWLFWIFPTQSAALQHVGETMGYGGVVRLTGLTFSCLAVILYLIARYGINGIINTWKFWRAGLFIGMIVLSLLGGYRAILILISLVFFFQFFYEGLHRTAALPIYACLFVVVSILTVANIQKMPLAVQRSLSFLPVEIDSVAATDASGTLEWRLEIWKNVVKEIPNYFWFGKGFSYRGIDYQLTFEAVQKGIFQAYEHVLIDGAYHHGLLTIIIPLGIWGILGFIWFAVSSWRIIHYNYLKSPPILKNINTLLLSYYSANMLFYCTLYGQFHLDLATFT